MKLDHNKMILIFSIVLLASISLACNLPVAFIRLKSFPLYNEREEDLVLNEVVGETSATLVNSEGEVVDLPILNWTTWECNDISGELSDLERTANALETLLLKSSNLDLSFRYNQEFNGISVMYEYDYEMDSAIVDGVTNKIIAWDHTKWFGENKQGSWKLKEGRYFSGSLNVVETREGTYPSSQSSEVTVVHNFFGLINRDNYHQAYYCDLRANPIPENLALLTPENFPDQCILWYYECTAK